MNKDEMRTQRLYLARGDSDVFVDSVVLPQHQIDGIRFLYQQYVKKKPGVILNDPPGYGKRVQTILFISAIRRLLQLPVLIICAEGKEQQWMHLFRTWTDMGTEVSIQKGNNMTINPICHITLVSHLHVVDRRDWSILVVDEHLAAFKILDSRLRTEYRIWLSSNNMKKRLPSFAFIYMWLYPKEKFDIEDFQANRNTPSALLTKSARLDAFIEDIVIRRRGITVPLGKSDETVYTTQVSRKNKDSTGKKIKRSKHNHEHRHEKQSEPSPNISQTQSSKMKDIIIDDDFKIEVENNEQFKMETDAVDKELSGITSKGNKYNNKSETKHDDKIKIINTEGTSVDVHIDFHKAAEDTKAAKNGTVMDFNTVDTSYKFLNNDDNISPNITFKYDSDTPDIEDDIQNDTNHTMGNEINGIQSFIESEDIFESGALSIDHKSNSQGINHDFYVSIDESSMKTDCELNPSNNEDVSAKNSQLNIVNSEKDDINCSKNDIVNEADDINCNENEIVNETDDINRNKNEIVNKNNVSENDKTEQKLEGVELKVKQLEELALKKFKGTFLDNMF